MVLGLLVLWEFIFGAATYSNYLNKSAWVWLWGGVSVGGFLFVVWRLWWLETYGWWIQRTLVLPELPLELKGLDWQATFDQEGVATQGRGMGKLDGAPRRVSYSTIKRVEVNQYSGLNIVAAGKTPLILGRMSEDERTRIVLLLDFKNPNVEFRGLLAATRDGWQPRL